MNFINRKNDTTFSESPDSITDPRRIPSTGDKQ